MSFLITVACVGGLAALGGSAGWALALAKAPMGSEGIETMTTLVLGGACAGALAGCYAASRLT